MTLREACKSALTILKQVMEEKLNATNVEVGIDDITYTYIIKKYQNSFFDWLHTCLVVMQFECNHIRYPIITSI